MKRTPISRKSSLKPVSAKRNSSMADYKRAKKEIMQRSNGACEARVPGVCTGGAEHAHHKRRRSKGGKDEAANLIAVCFHCHEWIHTHPGAAVDAGLLVGTKSSVPEEVWTLEYKAKVWTANSAARMHMGERIKLTKQWRTDFFLLAKHEKIPRLAQARIIVTPFQRMGRLQDVAACAPASKAAIDGLVDAGVLHDDSSEYLTSIEFKTPQRGENMLRIEIAGMRET
jgi:hypothetical protein